MLIERSIEEAVNGELIHKIKAGMLVVHCKDAEDAEAVFMHLRAIWNTDCEITFDT